MVRCYVIAGVEGALPRYEVLDANVFESLHQLREITHRWWIAEYNEEHSHDSLEWIPPTMFRRQIETARNSNL